MNKIKAFIIKLMLLFSLSAVLAVSCSSSSLAEESDLYSINGRNLTVRLDGNATTGYSWNYSIEDESIVEFGSSDYLVDSKYLSSGMVGYGGTWEFKFNALSAGSTFIHFSYERTWEKDSTVKRIDLKITVSEFGNVKVEVTEE